MKQVEERYISLLTDFGFKRIFGSAPNKDLLICFLNSLFNGRQVVKDVKYLNPENVGDIYTARKAIFDVYCEGENGEKFIVEMQNAYQTYFKDRALFYSTFPIQNQGKKGIWDFKLKGVYTVGILDFVFPDNEYPKNSLRHEVKLMDVGDKHVFYDKLTFLYLEMPKFTKKEEELKTMYDKWLFVLHNLSRLMKRPAALQERIFTRLFEQAEIARYTPEERQDYEGSLKVYRDMKNVLDTAELKGLKKGIEQGMEKGVKRGIEQGASDERKKNAKAMKTLGLPLETIAKVTGMAIDDIENYRLLRPLSCRFILTA